MIDSVLVKKGLLWLVSSACRYFMHGCSSDDDAQGRTGLLNMITISRCCAVSLNKLKRLPHPAPLEIKHIGRIGRGNIVPRKKRMRKKSTRKKRIGLHGSRFVTAMPLEG
eukprot:1149421-Pelagomonas_calceolata.AAC.8